MKTIEEKARAYDEVLNKLRHFIAKGVDPLITRADVQDFFPELAESENEKVRKWCISHFKECINVIKDNDEYKEYLSNKVLAWLEKQGDVTKLSEEEQNRFAKGVLTSCAMSFIDYLDAHKYEGKMCVSNGECEDIENAFHNAIWDKLHRYYCKYIEKQAEVKESAISQHENRTCEENGNSLTYEDEKVRKEIINYFQCQSEEEPTRKEIHNKWIAWLENIPVIIDHEKREGFHLGYKAGLEKQGEQKPVEENKGNIGGIFPNWSEEDERLCQCLIEDQEEFLDRVSNDKYGHSEIISDLKEMYHERIDWLKSLQDRVQPQPKQGWRAEDEAVLDALIRRLKGEDIYVSPHLAVECLESLKGRVLPKQEWSEEDEQHIDSLLKRLDALCRNKFERTRFAISEDRDWLKSLRPQNRWKPSDEQMEALWLYAEQNNYDGAVLTSLYNDLKKLKEKV